MKYLEHLIRRFKELFRGEVSLNTLRKRGLKYGENFQKQDTSLIDYWYAHLIEIGDNVTIAPKAIILAHDASTKSILGFTKIGRVIIGNNVFIGAGSIILPNVIIGSNVIIAAGSVVTKNISDNSVVAGNPATEILKYDDYIENQTKIMEKSLKFPKEYSTNLTTEKTIELKRSLVKGIGFIE